MREKEINANLIFTPQAERVIDTENSESLIKMRKVFTV